MPVAGRILRSALQALWTLIPRSLPYNHFVPGSGLAAAKHLGRERERERERDLAFLTALGSFESAKEVVSFGTIGHCFPKFILTFLFSFFFFLIRLERKIRIPELEEVRKLKLLTRG